MKCFKSTTYFLQIWAERYRLTSLQHTLSLFDCTCVEHKYSYHRKCRHWQYPVLAVSTSSSFTAKRKHKISGSCITNIKKNRHSKITSGHNSHQRQHLIYQTMFKQKIYADFYNFLKSAHYFWVVFSILCHSCHYSLSRFNAPLCMMFDSAAFPVILTDVSRSSSMLLTFLFIFLLPKQNAPLWINLKNVPYKMNAV